MYLLICMMYFAGNKRKGSSKASITAEEVPDLSPLPLPLPLPLPIRITTQSQQAAAGKQSHEIIQTSKKKRTKEGLNEVQ